MEAQAKQAKWVVPILIVTMTALTLIALVSWVQVVFGGVMPGTASFGGAGGMMINTANTGPAGGPAGGTQDMNAHMKTMMGSGGMAKNCAKMQNDPKMPAMHDNCAKTMGSNSDNMQQQMNGSSSTTKQTL